MMDSMVTSQGLFHKTQQTCKLRICNYRQILTVNGGEIYITANYEEKCFVEQETYQLLCLSNQLAETTKTIILVLKIKTSSVRGRYLSNSSMYLMPKRSLSQEILLNIASKMFAVAGFEPVLPSVNPSYLYCFHQCDKIDVFFRQLFSVKVAQIFGNFVGQLKSVTLKIKTTLATFGKFWRLFNWFSTGHT